MKTYLTPEEFADLFWEFYKSKMDHGRHSITDEIIWSLFQECEDDIKDTLASSFYGIDEYDGAPANIIGYQFHKSFRQVAPIDAKYVNGIVWKCMQDAPIFWKCMGRACDVLVKEDAKETYADYCE